MIAVEPKSDRADDGEPSDEQGDEKRSDLGQLFHLLGLHLGKYKVLLVAVGVLQLVQTIATLYLPNLNADIIDKGIAAGDSGYIWRTGGVMLAITAVQVVFALGAVFVGAKAAMGFGRDVRRSLFHHVTGLSTREVGQFGSASLITRITNDVQQVQMLVLMTFTLLVAAPITMIGGVVLALRQDVGLSGLLLVSIPVLVIAIGIVIGRMIPQFQRMQSLIDRVNKVLREQLTGIRVVRAFTREPDERTRFATANDDLTATALRVGRLTAYMSPIVLLVLNGSSVAALWLGADRVQGGDLQIGQLIAFLSYLAQILSAVMMATFMAVMIPRAAVSAQRINDVLETKSSLTQASPSREVSAAIVELEIRDVTFQYPGADDPVLTDINLTARAGQTTAIIGGTGSGKTTLVNLLPRLFDVSAGRVLVNGIDVRDLGLGDLRTRIGLVPQRPFLFSGTVASNLRLADPAASDEDLWAALRIAQATEFVRDLPGELDAPISQGGTNVSGGQRQRLAIAHALVHRPNIYVFDDSFSALDLSTDARVREELRGHTADAIVVIIGQRVSSIRDADQILVLDDGRQVGLGTHDELLDRCGTYIEIVESQHREDQA